MQIVINLEDEIYEDIKYRYDKDQLTLGAMVLELAILHGEVLPKGHGRLIDADTYRKDMMDSQEFNFFKILDMQSTIVEADESEDK